MPVVVSPCGSDACPVAPLTDELLDSVSSVAVDDDRTWYRGGNSRFAFDELVPGAGDSRFAPLPGTGHVYVGATRTVALLESALHEASGPQPTVYQAQLVGLAVAGVKLTITVRLADLRDAQLDRMGVARKQLVNTTPAHYPCTRAWATQLQDHRVEDEPLHGILWHSRQADLHAQATAGGVFADVVRHQAAEVAVLWHPHGPEQPLVQVEEPEHLVDDGVIAPIVVQLSGLIGAPIE